MNDDSCLDHEGKQREIKALGNPEWDPYEISFSEEYIQQHKKHRRAFVNRYGVIIGDHQYDSPNSPLHQWSEEIDPEIMSGDEWVHPLKDIGFHSDQNRNFFEQGIAPSGGIMNHPAEDAASNLILNKVKPEENA